LKLYKKGKIRKLKKLIQEVFKYYNKKTILRKEFEEYFLKKGMTREEVNELWSKAHSKGLIEIEVIPEADPNNPLNITGRKIVFELENEEEKDEEE